VVDLTIGQKRLPWSHFFHFFFQLPFLVIDRLDLALRMGPESRQVPRSRRERSLCPGFSPADVEGERLAFDFSEAFGETRAESRLEPRSVRDRGRRGVSYTPSLWSRVEHRASSFSLGEGEKGGVIRPLPPIDQPIDQLVDPVLGRGWGMARLDGESSRCLGSGDDLLDSLNDPLLWGA
jgi:hypothetical protein